MMLNEVSKPTPMRFAGKLLMKPVADTKANQWVIARAQAKLASEVKRLNPDVRVLLHSVPDAATGGPGWLKGVDLYLYRGDVEGYTGARHELTNPLDLKILRRDNPDTLGALDKPFYYPLPAFKPTLTVLGSTTLAGLWNRLRKPVFLAQYQRELDTVFRHVVEKAKLLSAVASIYPYPGAQGQL